MLIERKKSLVLDKSSISQVIWLLKSHKHVIVTIRKDKAPSLHLAPITLMTFRETLRNCTSLIDYIKTYGNNSSAEDVSEEDYVEEDKSKQY